MKSWKIGAVSGLIAGTVAGISMIVIAIILFDVATYLNLEPPPITPIMKVALVEITNNIVWGIILGIIFSRIYNLIPIRNSLKGFVFGLIYYVIYSIRFAVIATAYGYFLVGIGTLLHIHPIIYGLVLGVLYKTPSKKLEINTYYLKRGFYVGAFAGIAGGIVSILGEVIANIGGLEKIPGQLGDIEFYVSQLGADILFDMAWGIIYGVLFAMFYDRIPFKGVLKGLIYGLTIFLITNVRLVFYDLAYGLIRYALIWFFPGIIVWIVYGLVLGALYKPKK